MGKFVQRLYYSMIIVGLVLILVCGMGTMDDAYEEKLQEAKPIRMEQVSDAVQCYYFEVDKDNIYGTDLVVFSHHQFVRVYADGKEIYTQTKGGGIWGKSSGSMWNFISIPYGKEEVRVEIEAVYKSVEKEEHIFYIGNSLSVYKNIMKSSIGAMLVSLVLVLMGTVMTVYGIKVNRRLYTERSMIYLGIFILIFGLWSFNETDGATLLFNHRVTSSFSAFIYLMMLIFSFLLFTRDFIAIEENIVWKIIGCTSVVNFVLGLGLQFAGIADLKETVIITHVMMVVSIFYIIIMLMYKLIKGNTTSQVKNNLKALIVLIMTAIVDLVFYYRGIVDGDMFGRFLFFLFAAILGRETMRSSMKMIERGKTAQLYEELAMTDRLTGLYNRNCYEIDELEYDKKSGVLVVTFDLNNLKKCNDTMGHSEGDYYIKMAADIIEKTFSSYGKCYRIGGDEFLVLIEKGERCPIDELEAQMSFEQRRYNYRARFPMHIAVGYSLYDAEKDEGIEKARDRADELMYENKKKSKERNK